jgi:predicted nuclease of restriction endonuclease-like (RecB) superfamily
MGTKRKTVTTPPREGESPSRLVRGRDREGVAFPVPPSHAMLPMSYSATLRDLKERIRTERLRVALSANAAMTLLYWDIGQVILQRQEREGWGTKVIDRLSADLREAFPDMQGLSARNLKYMRKFAEAWPDRAIVQRAAAQIPWRNNQALLDKLVGHEIRLWYTEQNILNGWSRDVLTLQIENNLHKRQGKAVHNFAVALPPADSDMAAQIFKDPYLFDFIGTADPRREREVEQALVNHVQKFLLELGAGFAFVGRQVHLEFSSADYYLDLLFYHLKLRCYVVVELKAVPFAPEFVGKLNMYMSAVDDLLRHVDDKPTIGLLLCKGKDRIIAEYALSGFNRPIGVADWKKQLTETLPTELKGSLPTVEEIETELGDFSVKTEAAASQGGDASECREPRARYGAENVRIVPAPFDATDGADTPFGRRWGGGVTQLTPKHLAALTEGKTLALDVRNEYIQFLKAQASPGKRSRTKKGVPREW